LRKKYMVLTSVIVSVLLSLSLVGVTQTYTPTPAVGVTQTYTPTPAGVYNPDADINKDGIVSGSDLAALARAWYTKGNPYQSDIWANISELQSQVRSLNESLQALKAKQPRILTAYKNSVSPDRYGWSNVISIGPVSVWSGASVLATVTFSLDEGYQEWALEVRHKMNEVYGETRRQGGYCELGSVDYDRIVEIHHPWLNLTEGTYTFTVEAIEGGTFGPGDLCEVRLTLLIV